MMVRINRQWLEEHPPEKTIEPTTTLPISSRNEAEPKSEQSQASEMHSL
jgi:hypothetical protein